MCCRARRRISLMSARKGWLGCIVAMEPWSGCEDGRRGSEAHKKKGECTRAHRRVTALATSADPSASQLFPSQPAYLRYRNGWMADPLIRARNLSKVYKSGTADLVVFAEVNLDVERGEMLALVGESGAGKSTLLHLLGGLDRPSAVRYTTGVQRFQVSLIRSRRIFATGKLGSFGRFTISCLNSRRWRT